MAEVRLFVTEFGETINNIKRLEEELKRLKQVYKDAAVGSDEFNRAQAAIKEVTAILKQHTNALGGINSAAKFAEGSYGKLKQQIKENKEMLDKVRIGTKLHNALLQEQILLENKRIAVEEKIPSLLQKRVTSAIDQSKAIQGLNMSMMQLTREMPAFANSIQTGFMAISNNLPIFFDAIKRIKEENKALASEGKATTSVFKSVVGSLFSVGSLLSIGVTLLTVYGAKLVESVAALTAQSNALKTASENQEDLNKAVQEGTKAATKDVIELDILYRTATNLNLSIENRKKAVDKLQETYPSYFGNLQDEIILTGKAVEKYKELRDAMFDSARAKAVQSELEKRSAERVEKEFALREKLKSTEEEINRLKKEGTDLVIKGNRAEKEKDIFVSNAELIKAQQSKLILLQNDLNTFMGNARKEDELLLNAQSEYYQKSAKLEADKIKVKEKTVKTEKKGIDDEIKVLEAAIQRKKNLNEDSMHEEIALEKYKLNQILKDNTKSNGDRLKAQEEYFKNVGKIQRESIQRNIDEEHLFLKASIKQAIVDRGEGFDEERKLAQYNYEIGQQQAKDNFELLKEIETIYNDEMRRIDSEEIEYSQKIIEEQLEIQRNYLKQIQEDKLIQAETLKNIDEVNYQDDLDNLNEQFELKQEALLLQRDQELLGLEEFSKEYNNIVAKYKNEEYKLNEQFVEEKKKLNAQEIQSAFDTMQVISTLGELLATNGKQQTAFQKMSALATVAMNTGIAISNLVATSFSALSPDNIATGGVAAYAKLAAGLLAVTTNMAQAQQIINSFEEGGYTGEGNPHEVSTNLGSKSYTYHKDEYVIPSRVLNTPKGSALAGQLENMRLGMSNPMPHISGMFDGGFTGRSAGMETTNMLENQIMMQKFIESMPNPVVRVTDINRTQGSVQRAVNVSSL